MPRPATSQRMSSSTPRRRRRRQRSTASRAARRSRTWQPTSATTSPRRLEGPSAGSGPMTRRTASTSMQSRTRRWATSSARSRPSADTPCWRCSARREATTDSPLRELLAQQGVSDEAYRAYVSDALLVEAYRDHFADEVVSSPTAQRRVAQIFIAAPTAPVVPQERARHVLINPLPADAAEGDVATDEQWAAALARGRGGARPARGRRRRLVRDREGAQRRHRLRRAGWRPRLVSTRRPRPSSPSSRRRSPTSRSAS